MTRFTEPSYLLLRLRGSYLIPVDKNRFRRSAISTAYIAFIWTERPIPIRHCRPPNGLGKLERLVDTYLFCSFPLSVFAFQGGDPTLAGIAFFEKLIEFQESYGRDGQIVNNSFRTNALAIDRTWYSLFRSYHWLLGISLDGPEEQHDRYRYEKVAPTVAVQRPE